jgi:ligand-binding SRPBCC domain-containing protein
MSKIYQLFREQTVSTDLDTAWDFICSPRNLDLMTPDDLSFEILTDLPDTMFEGLLIEYRIGIPFLGKQTWLTELKHIRERQSFVDEQRVGPYALWLHYHGISAVEGGVRFVDHVHYVMPLGPIGRLAHAVFVRRQLDAIFAFRRNALERHLGAGAAGSGPRSGSTSASTSAR